MRLLIPSPIKGAHFLEPCGRYSIAMHFWEGAKRIIPFWNLCQIVRCHPPSIWLLGIIFKSMIGYSREMYCKQSINPKNLEIKKTSPVTLNGYEWPLGIRGPKVYQCSNVILLKPRLTKDQHRLSQGIP